MKRIFLFALVFVMIWAADASAKRLAVHTGKANVRSGPGTKHEILWTAGKYYPVDVIGQNGKWYKVRDFEGDQGWIFRSLLKKTPAVIVKASMANVRTGAGTNFRILFKAEKGVSFKLLRRQGKWFNVRHADGEVGWVHRSLLWGH